MQPVLEPTDAQLILGQQPWNFDRASAVKEARRLSDVIRAGRNDFKMRWAFMQLSRKQYNPKPAHKRPTRAGNRSQCRSGQMTFANALRECKGKVGPWRGTETFEKDLSKHFDRVTVQS